MSIFLEVTREFVMNAIDNIKKRLEADDQGYVGMLRDRTLSEAKKTLMGELLNGVRLLKDAKSDVATKEILCREVLKVKCQAFKRSHESGQGEGKLGLELGDLHSLIELIYSKFEQCHILDLDHSKDPYHIFAYQSGYYLAYKAAQSFEVSCLGYFTHHPNVSDLWKLTNQKETILKTQLMQCKEALDALNREHPQYKDHYKTRVIDFIDAVVRENEKACGKHKAFLNLPLITFGFFSLFSAGSSIAPKPGFIEVCMQRAKIYIENPVEPQLSAMAALEIEEDDEKILGRRRRRRSIASLKI